MGFSFLAARKSDAWGREHTKGPWDLSFRLSRRRALSGADLEIECAGPGACALLQLCLQGVDVISCHFTIRRHLAINDLPQPERAGDIAIFVEGDWADDAFVADRLAVLDQAERLGEPFLAGIDRRSRRVDSLEHRVLIFAGSSDPANAMARPTIAPAS